MFVQFLAVIFFDHQIQHYPIISKNFVINVELIKMTVCKSIILISIDLQSLQNDCVPI